MHPIQPDAANRGLSLFDLDAYLLNMAVRLLAMRRALKPTGSIYLHCDPTASHYLKLIMDAIFGKQNFRNEIMWCYKSGGASPAKHFSRKHDVILFYTKESKYQFNEQREKSYNRDMKPYRFAGVEEYEDKVGWYTLVGMKDYWQIDMIGRTSRERLGYPTQKPLALLERIITASSPPDGLVLDPFCGCGTAVHAAEKLGRRWIGVDVSAFATGLVRNRILHSFDDLTTDDVLVKGVPVNIGDAEALAKQDKFEFEKWVCGAIGAEGMFHEPGAKGADGGVDGVLPFVPVRWGENPAAEFAIIQVKGGSVTADAVKALETTVNRLGATAGVFVCFNRYMQTVANQRGDKIFKDDLGFYPVIQGYSVEDLLANKPLRLPPHKNIAKRMPKSARNNLQTKMLSQ